MRLSSLAATFVVVSSSALWSSAAWSQTPEEAPPDPSAEAPVPAAPVQAAPVPAAPVPAAPIPEAPPYTSPTPYAPPPYAAPPGQAPTGAPWAPAARPMVPAAPRYTGDTVINDPLLLGIGIALTAVATIGTVVGVAVAANSDRTDPCYSGPCPNIEIGQRAAGLVVTFTSLGLLGAGIPMTAVGARSVPEVLAPGQTQLRIRPTSVAWVW